MWYVVTALPIGGMPSHSYIRIPNVTGVIPIVLRLSHGIYCLPPHPLNTNSFVTSQYGGRVQTGPRQTQAAILANDPLCSESKAKTSQLWLLPQMQIPFPLILGEKIWLIELEQPVYRVTAYFSWGCQRAVSIFFVQFVLVYPRESMNSNPCKI